MEIKELALFGGLVNKAEARAHQQIIPEKTVLVSIISPNGIPITPLCYIAIGESTLQQIADVLADDNYKYSLHHVKVREETELDVKQAEDGIRDKGM